MAWLDESPEVIGDFAETEIAVQMDPRLQLAIARRSRGQVAEASVSSEVDEVAVIARVTDPAEWAAASEVRACVTIGAPDADDGTVIMTGRIPVTRIEAVRRFPFVKSLKAAYSLRPALSAGVAETAMLLA